jgi:hypothetical protein
VLAETLGPIIGGPRAIPDDILSQKARDDTHFFRASRLGKVKRNFMRWQMLQTKNSCPPADLEGSVQRQQSRQQA